MHEQHNGAEIITGWKPPARPGPSEFTGRYARLARLNADKHAADLHRANSASASQGIWTYLPYGPFSSASGYHHWARDMAILDDPCFYTVFDLNTGRAGGVLSLMSISPEAGSIEVGHINFAPELQRSRAATEAVFMVMEWAFQQGYRRLVWKCDAKNMRSRRAAERFGFSYEGIFRQHVVSKGRNRDTAWYAAIDKDWPALKEAYTTWLAPGNFDAAGTQSESLADFTQLVRVSQDPALSD